MVRNREQELATLIDSVQQAGAHVRKLVRDGFEVQTKADHSPVTTVDHEVNRILYDMQRREFPSDGWLSEESPDDLARLDHDRVWIIDPIDGTRALVNRVPEFCISAALIERGFPVVAAILNPSTNELFTAVRGGGLFLNGSRVTLSPLHDFDPVIMVGARECRQGLVEDEGFPCSVADRSAAFFDKQDSGRHIPFMFWIEGEGGLDTASCD